MGNYNRNSRCKICNSNLNDEIDKLLEQGKSYQSICDWANNIEPDMNLFKKNVWSHNTKHRNQDNETKKPPRKGRQKGIENEKIENVETKKDKKKIKKVVKKVIKKNIAQKNNDDKIKENETVELNLEKTTEFLDTIINKVKKRIDDGEIKPTITEGIKATELKIKIEKGSPYEEVMISFLEGISTKDANKD